MNTVDDFFTQNITVFTERYFSYLNEVLKAIDKQEIEQFISTILDARKRKVNIFFIGNGGSASTASHYANDLSIGTQSFEHPFKVISLTDNQAVITAIANDYGYDQIFVQQLRVLANKGDVVVGISASGNSSNLINAFNYAKANGIKTVALTAFNGGKMKEIADEGIHVPTEMKEYGPAEDAHMILDHLVHAYLHRFINL